MSERLIVDKPLAGKWEFNHFTKHDGMPIESVQDVADTLARSATYSDKAELWGVSGISHDFDEGAPVVCYTGNGPTSKANARLISAAPDLLEALRHAVEIIEKHVPIDALVHESQGDPEVGMQTWPLLEEYLHYMKHAIAKAVAQ